MNEWKLGQRKNSSKCFVLSSLPAITTIKNLKIRLKSFFMVFCLSVCLVLRQIRISRTRACKNWPLLLTSGNSMRGTFSRDLNERRKLTSKKPAKNEHQKERQKKKLRKFKDNPYSENFLNLTYRCKVSLFAISFFTPYIKLN